MSWIFDVCVSLLCCFMQGENMKMEEVKKR